MAVISEIGGSQEVFYAFLSEVIVSVCKFCYSLDGVDAVNEWDNLGSLIKVILVIGRFDLDLLHC